MKIQEDTSWKQLSFGGFQSVGGGGLGSGAGRVLPPLMPAKASMKQTAAASLSFAALLAEHCWFTFPQNEGKSWWFWPQVFLGIFPPHPSSYHPPQKKICLVLGFVLDFFQHPLEYKLSGTTGSFSLSFVSPETDLFKWYAGSTLLLKALVLVVFQALVQLSWKLWKMGLSQRILFSPEAVFFCIFPKRFPFPVFCEECCLFPCDWEARKLFECSAPSQGEHLAAWLEVQMTVTAPTRGTSTPVPSFCSARGSHRVLYHSCIYCLASPLAACHPDDAAFHYHQVILSTRSHDLAVSDFWDLFLRSQGFASFSFFFFLLRDSSPFTWALT